MSDSSKLTRCTSKPTITCQKWHVEVIRSWSPGSPKSSLENRPQISQHITSLSQLPPTINYPLISNREKVRHAACNFCPSLIQVLELQTRMLLQGFKGLASKSSLDMAWHGLATHFQCSICIRYPYVQLSVALSNHWPYGKCRTSGRSVKIIEPYWTSVIYWRRENPRSFACGFCLGVKLLLLLLQFMTLLHEAFCSSLKHRRLWKTQRIEYRIEHDRTKMNLSRPMFQCFTKYYKVQFGSCFRDFSVDAKSRRRASCR